MNDEELCSMFGTSLEEVERDVQRVYEGADFTGVVFGEPIDGLPPARLKTSSVKFYESELKAIDMAARKAGISRSAFIRRACENELASC